MPHLRKRHLDQQLRKYGKFWPVIGVLGLRQIGKTTLLREMLEVSHYCSMDDEQYYQDAKVSSKQFLAKLQEPVIIDEVQKVPSLFDSIKLRVDRNKKPGMYYLIGSSQFSSKLGIRESLTGRIGILKLFPFTLAEIHQKDFPEQKCKPIHTQKLTFPTETMSQSLAFGGLPVPLFTRDEAMRRQYFQNWLDTSLYRDAPRVFGRSYDPELAFSILRQMGQTLRQGELPTLKHFKTESRKLKKYLETFEIIFILNKIKSHEQGIGHDVWLPSDCGLANYLTEGPFGEETNLSLIRISVLNEILALCEYSGKPIKPTYYKSARGGPIDLIWDGIPIKISSRTRSQLSYDERALTGCMKKLNAPTGILVSSFDTIEIPKTPSSDSGVAPGTAAGIAYVPWTFWS